MKIINQLTDTLCPLVSIEFFPPKTEKSKAAFDTSSTELRKLQADFVSVTCGAGGTAEGETLGICEELRTDGYETVMPHLTCVGATREQIGHKVDELYERGFRNIMALRGDPPRGESSFTPVENGFLHAVELVRFIKERQPDICIGVAGYPEGHPEAASIDKDIEYLKEKVDAGADFITTQLFLHNHVYFEFVKKCRAAGITVPIVPGLLPVISLTQVTRMLNFCKFHLPIELLSKLEAADGDPAKMERVGVYWAIEQISELIEGGAPGIHLYLLNRAQTAFFPELFACLSRIRKP